MLSTCRHCTTVSRHYSLLLQGTGGCAGGRVQMGGIFKDHFLLEDVPLDV
jgi:hypothetical protein